MGSESNLKLPTISPIQIGVEDPTQTSREECQTPKSNIIKPLPVCPPAPKKRKPPPRKARQPPYSYFVVPDDLGSIFIALPIQANKRIKSGGLKNPVCRLQDSASACRQMSTAEKEV